MSDFFIDGNESTFTIYSGSQAIPVFKIDGNVVTVKASGTNAFSDITTVAYTAGS